MTGAELAAEIAEAIAQDSRLDAIREKIEAGTADLKDSEQYTAICAEITGRMMRGAVAGLDDREESFTEIARERYRETFDIYSTVQAIIDRALGIRIAAKEPGFQEDRARKIGHALEDQTVPESTILRRAESASENFVMSQHDRCVEENAKFRDRAGLQSYAVRTGGAKCCQWCADVSGKYPANETPDGFWGRHDNCKCSILYESKRSGRQLLRGTSKKWEVAAEGAGAGELHRLSAAEAAAAGAPDPVVFTKEQAERLQAEKGLTKPAESGTIETRNMANGMRRSPMIPLTDADKKHIQEEIVAIGADPEVFVFRDGSGSGYSDRRDIIFVSSNVFPSSDDSTHPRDRMSERAVLAHEYYGHRAHRGTSLPQGSWNDEFRASYSAAKNCPNLTDEDRYYLVLDAIERAREAGVSITYNDFMRRVLYG